MKMLNIQQSKYTTIYFLPLVFFSVRFTYLYIFWGLAFRQTDILSVFLFIWNVFWGLTSPPLSLRLPQHKRHTLLDLPPQNVIRAPLAELPSDDQMQPHHTAKPQDKSNSEVVP